MSAFFTKKINNMLFSWFQNRIEPSIKSRLGGLSPAALGDEAVVLNQVFVKDGTGTITEVVKFTGANTHTGVETHTGAETHSGAEVFSNVLGVTTDAITERTAGAGTTIKSPVVSAGAATLAPTIAQSGSLIALAKADGLTVTLPAASSTNIGVRYKFVVAVSCTSVGYVINTTGTDVFLGAILGTIAAGTNLGLFASTVNKTITLDATTKGGLIGGWIEVTCVSGTQWSVTGVTLGSGTVITPFSN